MKMERIWRCSFLACFPLLACSQLRQRRKITKGKKFNFLFGLRFAFGPTLFFPRRDFSLGTFCCSVVLKRRKKSQTKISSERVCINGIMNDSWGDPSNFIPKWNRIFVKVWNKCYLLYILWISSWCICFLCYRKRPCIFRRRAVPLYFIILRD